MLAIFGLFVILLGWIVQSLHFDQKRRFHPFFLLSYAAGTAFLVIDAFSTRTYIVGSLHLLILCVIMLLLTKKR